MASNIAAIHLITANAQIGAPVLSASILIFGGAKAREDFVVSNWEELLQSQGDSLFAESNRNHILLLVNSGAEIIEESMLCSRVVGAQARHMCAGTIWQNHYESHVSHYAYLYALVGQKRDIMLKGHNLDGHTLNAANRFVAEYERSIPTCASSPEAGLFYLKELYISAKRLLGHDIDSDGAKIIKQSAPTVAAAVSGTIPSLPAANVTAPSIPALPGGGAPSIPVPSLPSIPTVNQLTAPALPPTMPTLPPSLP